MRIVTQSLWDGVVVRVSALLPSVLRSLKIIIEVSLEPTMASTPHTPSNSAATRIINAFPYVALAAIGKTGSPREL